PDFRRHPGRLYTRIRQRGAVCTCPRLSGRAGRRPAASHSLWSDRIRGEAAGMDVDVRFARVKEARAVHRILMEAFGPYAGKIKPPFQVFQETPEGIAADMRRRRHRYAVALVEDVPVGTFRLTSALSAARGRHCLLSRLAVPPDFQGRLVAHPPSACLAERAERHKVPELRGHGRSALPRRIRFYPHFGYRVLGYRSL